MKITKILIRRGIAALSFLLFLNVYVNANPQITASNLPTQGEYKYGISQLPSDVTNAFWILGDGHFRTGLVPQHYLKEMQTNHQVQAYLLSPYKVSPPPKLFCGGGCTGNGVAPANYTNHAVALGSSQFVKIGTSWNPMQGRIHYTIITFENLGNTSDGRVKLTFHNNQIDNLVFDTLENSSTWTTNQTISIGTAESSIEFDFYNLQPGEQRHVLIKTLVNSNTTNDHIYFTTEMLRRNIWNSNFETVYQNNSSVLIKKYPHDPNLKEVSETEICAENNEAITLEYQITFQNIGDDYANTVRILDDLPVELDLSTFQLTGYSSPCTVSWNNNEVKFVFEEIELPGLDQTLPYIPHPNETIGFVTFEIDTKHCLDEGVIINEAVIFFDDLAEIRTPEAETAILLTDYCSIHNISCENENDDGETGLPDPPGMDFVNQSGGTIGVFPNPFAEVFDLEVVLEETQASAGRLAIFNVRGELMADLTDQLSWEAGRQQLNIMASDWTKGIYFVQLENLNETRTWKIIKM